MGGFMSAEAIEPTQALREALRFAGAREGVSRVHNGRVAVRAEVPCPRKSGKR